MVAIIQLKPITAFPFTQGLDEGVSILNILTIRREKIIVALTLSRDGREGCFSPFSREEVDEQECGKSLPSELNPNSKTSSIY